MNPPLFHSTSIHSIKTITLDLVAFLLVYFTPALSHLFSVPLYYFEPMRLMIILAIVHTSSVNAYILAFTLPVFSWLVSAHPDFTKMILITVELLLNVHLFYFFHKISGKLFYSILGSIFLSKVVYYSLKFFLIQYSLLQGSLITTPILFQILTGLLFSIYLTFTLKNE